MSSGYFVFIAVHVLPVSAQNTIRATASTSSQFGKNQSYFAIHYIRQKPSRALALGAQPQNLLKSVITEGACMAVAGIIAGGSLGYLLARFVGSYVLDIRMPGLIPVILSAFTLLLAAVVASFLPAARAARIDAMQAPRSE